MVAEPYPGQNLADLPKPTDKRARFIESADFTFTTWAHVLEHGEDWRAVFEPVYWENCAHRFRPGDRVEIFAEEYRVQFTLFVLAVNHRVSPCYLELAARPVLPADLELPQKVGADRSRYQVRRMPGVNRFEVYDRVDRIVPVSNLNRADALDRSGLLELQAREAETAIAEPPARAKAS